jgi:hypothetical protein
MNGRLRSWPGGQSGDQVHDFNAGITENGLLFAVSNTRL